MIAALLAAGFLFLQRQREIRPAPRRDMARELVTQQPRPTDAVAALREAARSVVMIEAVGPNGRRTLGAGLVLDREGNVLTCLHVIVQTVNGAVGFSSGAAYELEGCTAFDPQRDLAIVRLKNPPQDVLPLQLGGDARLDRAVYAVGHPGEHRKFAVESGRLLQSLSADELPDDSRRFLQGLTPGGETLHWLRHSTELEEGFSGGPLMTVDGAVLGINVWVDDATHSAFALDAREVAAFLETPRGEPIPLSKLALPEVRARAERWQLSGPRLQRLFDHARALQWQPATYDDYQILRQLATGVTLARQSDLLLSEGVVEKQIEALAAAADKATAELKRKKWRDAGQLTLINEFASLALTEPVGGLFAFARVQAADDDVAVLELAGFEETFSVSLTDQLIEPVVGKTYLVLGLIEPPTGDRAPVARPRVNCHTFLPLD